MEALGVLDVMMGVVVRGIAGRREQYRPIVSKLVASTDPLAVAKAYREHLGIDAVYLADLDAIMGQPLALTVLDALTAAGFSVWADVGVQRSSDAERLVDRSAITLVAGLETLESPKELGRLVERWGSRRVVFSLDLSGGRPLGNVDTWGTSDPVAIAAIAAEQGADRVLLLDLAQVGMGQGVGTIELLGQLRDRLPGVDVGVGGGVRSRGDLLDIARAGARFVLLASSLHDRTIERADLDAVKGTNESR